MRFIGKAIYVIGTICLTLTMLWTFIIRLGIVHRVAGFWDIVIGIALLPAVFIAAPWYALIAHHQWDPLIIAYGGTSLCSEQLGSWATLLLRDTSD